MRNHIAGLRSGIRYPAWAPAGRGAFGASPAQALGRGGATVGGDADLTVSLYQIRLKYDYQQG